ncbi:MAG: hypothetical protein DMF64_20875 [Acidobacteria bacterium]|nr:MAG: hypothetical protein DMF64_20875 [Acidobacteriota bacterium]
MWRRLKALALICTLGGTLAAGAPLHTGAHECNMSAPMGMMDCCALAHLQSNAPEVVAARLCCALNCPQPAPLNANNLSLRAPQVAQLAPPAPPAALPLAPALRLVGTRIPTAHSPPAYIQHLALLI